jgi:hypothetical protein
MLITPNREMTMTTRTRTPIPVDNQGVMYLHCGRCLDERPDGESPRDWARLSVGYTPIGVQVWCNRHDLNVVHIDFEGHTHPGA